MKTLRQKLRAQRGETLTETLCALIVIALSSALLATMFFAATHLNSVAQAQDDALYTQLAAAEGRQGGLSGTVTIKIGAAPLLADGSPSTPSTFTTATLPVLWYGGADALSAYALDPAGGTP